MSREKSKADDELKVHLPAELKIGLMNLAANHDRKLSDYIRHVLALHYYGHSEIFLSKSEGADSPE